VAHVLSFIPDMSDACSNKLYWVSECELYQFYIML
jgi:hypothetical protein